MDTEVRSVFRFGDIEVDPASRYVRRGGTDEYVRQQTFQVLLYLLEHRDRLIPKEELRQGR